MNEMRQVNHTRSRHRAHLPSFAIASIFSLAGGFVQFAAAQTVYTSTSAGGTVFSQMAPCNITQAQLSARSLASAGISNVTVTLAGGTYYLSSPLVISPQDSGINGYKVIWQATPRERCL